MTLVAAVALDSYPVIFGDLPVAGAERPTPAQGAPRGGGVADPPAGSEWFIPELDQKVVLLADNCVVAWAGNIESARAVIGELRAMAAEAPLSLARIETHLAQLGAAVKDEISLVGWVRDGELFRQFWYRADIAKGAMFGQISAAGSGATDFAVLASQISESGVDARGDMPIGLERAIASMLSATSLLLRAELSGASDVLRHFGDGYEIATFVGDRFAKLGDIAFVSWKADVADGQVLLSGPEFILKQDYAGEFLLLHALRMRPGKVSTDPPVIEETRRVISPFGTTVDAQQVAAISWPDMDSTFTCHVVLVRSPKDFAVVNQVEFSQSRTPRSIRFSLEYGQRPFGVSQKFCEELMQTIHAGFANL
jgi:hypothetical protein